MPAFLNDMPINIAFTSDANAIRIVDQSLLPNETRYLTLSSAESLYEAIASLRVRGAPAIGIFAAFSYYLLAKQAAEFCSNPTALLAHCRNQRTYLSSARPTAVNLSKMLNRCLARAEALAKTDVPTILSALYEEALAIQQEDISMCRAISEHGLSLLHEGDSVITHCNAGPLATSRYGTALGPLLLGKEQGFSFHVFCNETRPLLQGARLTTYELSRAGIPCTLICDNMASIVMQQGKVSACLVGCDRVARNGDTANKIGTSGLAILAQYYGIPFYVLGPSSSIDFSCPDGSHIPIELRDASEIKTRFFTKPSALSEVSCFNPAFDVTNASLITAIITERGICYPPFSESFPIFFPKEWEEAQP